MTRWLGGEYEQGPTRTAEDLELQNAAQTLKLSQDWTTPQRWFGHFYIVGLAVSTAVLSLYIHEFSGRPAPQVQQILCSMLLVTASCMHVLGAQMTAIILGAGQYAPGFVTSDATPVSPGNGDSVLDEISGVISHACHCLPFWPEVKFSQRAEATLQRGLPPVVMLQARSVHAATMWRCHCQLLRRASLGGSLSGSADRCPLTCRPRQAS